MSDKKLVVDISISIHAPAKGATFRLRAGCSAARYFNPRSREGSDVLSGAPAVFRHISIHAPAKGATISKAFNAMIAGIFQSTLPRRERPVPDLLIHFATHNISIHAPAKGATSIRHAAERYVRDFNPRSREGSDL